MRRALSILVLIVAGVCAHPALAADEGVKLLDQHLQAGTLAAGEQALAGLVKKAPGDDQARFALGTIRFLRSVEGLSQALYRHGFLQPLGRLGGGLIVGGNLPVPNNPRSEPLDYEQGRKIMQTFVSGLGTAEQTLSKVQSPDVKLPVHFGLIRLDLDGDGVAADDETLWRIYERFNRQARGAAADAQGFVIAFDAADVAWLRGYCHLLMALGEIHLAHDSHELFERAGHLLFAHVKSPHKFLADPPAAGVEQPFTYENIADVIALIHLLNFPVSEPKRMEVALQHLEAMVPLSRQSWDLILQETDDDHEWIPSPKQTGVIPNVRVTPEMVAGWQQFLSEVELILKGDKLIPFWRGTQPRGVNLRKVFTSPRQFDVVLWVQGTGATPYLEDGTLTDRAMWDRLLRVFQGEFIGFAFWFN